MASRTWTGRRRGSDCTYRSLRCPASQRVQSTVPSVQYLDQSTTLVGGMCAMGKSGSTKSKGGHGGGAHWRRVGSTIAVGVLTIGMMALPIIFSKKKRHYLTFYISNDPQVAAQGRERLAKDPRAVAKGDVVAFEINKQTYADVISILQAKTGVAVQNEQVRWSIRHCASWGDCAGWRTFHVGNPI
jgi:hypothetical protein